MRPVAVVVYASGDRHSSFPCEDNVEQKIAFSDQKEPFGSYCVSIERRLVKTSPSERAYAKFRIISIWVHFHGPPFERSHVRHWKTRSSIDDRAKNTEQHRVQLLCQCRSLMFSLCCESGYLVELCGNLLLFRKRRHQNLRRHETIFFQSNSVGRPLACSPAEIHEVVCSGIPFQIAGKDYALVDAETRKIVAHERAVEVGGNDPESTMASVDAGNQELPRRSPNLPRCRNVRSRDLGPKRQAFTPQAYTDLLVYSVGIRLHPGLLLPQ